LYGSEIWGLEYTLRYTVPRILLDIMRTFIPFRDFERGKKVCLVTIFSHFELV
jgi:hypothetical protein